MKSTLKQKILAVLCSFGMGFSVKAFVGCENYLTPTVDPKPGITSTETPDDKENQGKPGENVPEQNPSNPGQNNPEQTNPGQENPEQNPEQNPGQDVEKELPIDRNKIYASDTPEFKQEMGKVEKALSEIVQTQNFKMEVSGSESYCGIYEIGNDIIKFYNHKDYKLENPTYYYEENGQKYKITCEKRDKVLANYKEPYEGELDFVKEELESLKDVQFEQVEKGRVVGKNDKFNIQTYKDNDSLIIFMHTADGIYNDFRIYDMGKVENKLPEDVADLTFKPDYEKTQKDIIDYVSMIIQNQNFTYEAKKPDKDIGYEKYKLMRDGNKTYINKINFNGAELKEFYEKDDGHFHKWVMHETDYEDFHDYEDYLINDFVEFDQELKDLLNIVIKPDSYKPTNKMYYAVDKEKFEYWIRLDEDGTLSYDRYFYNSVLDKHVKIYDVGNTHVTLPERKAENENQDQTENVKMDDVKQQEVEDSKRRILAVLKSGDISKLKADKEQKPKDKASQFDKEIGLNK